MRRRILLTLLASTSTVLVAFLVPLMVMIGDFAVDRAQRQLVLEVQPLVSRIPVTDPQDMDSLVRAFTEQTSRPATLYLANNAVLGTVRPLDSAVELARAKGAFFTDTDGGRDLLVPVHTDSGEAVLRVLMADEQLNQTVLRARLALLALGLLLLGLSVGLGLLLARAFLRPIGQLSSTAEQLAAGELDARVPPVEIREIDNAGRALNRLAARVVELLGLEREEVADLAHRLRTPVAALRLDTDTLPETDAADRLRDDVDRLERMVDEVIREARRPVRENIPASADLSGVVRERTAFWSVLAEDQGRDLTVDAPIGSIFVAAEARDLGDALDALIGNVFAHTPEGVAFRVAVARSSATTAWVEVADDGPGIPAADVLERGRSEAGSTGLGLDIARRTAERGGGSIEIGSSPSGGARVRLVLHAAEPIA